MHGRKTSRQSRFGRCRAGASLDGLGAWSPRSKCRLASSADLSERITCERAGIFAARGAADRGWASAPRERAPGRYSVLSPGAVRPNGAQRRHPMFEGRNGHMSRPALGRADGRTAWRLSSLEVPSRHRPRRSYTGEIFRCHDNGSAPG